MHHSLAASTVPVAASSVQLPTARRAVNGGVAARELSSSVRTRVAAAYATDDVSEQPEVQQHNDVAATEFLPPPPPPPPPEARGQLRRTRFSDREFENPRFAPRSPGSGPRRDRSRMPSSDARGDTARGRDTGGQAGGRAPQPTLQQDQQQGLPGVTPAASQQSRQSQDIQLQQGGEQPGGQLRRTRYSGGEPRRDPARSTFVAMPHMDAIKGAGDLEELFQAINGVELTAVEASVSLHMVVLNARRAHQRDAKARGVICARPEVTQLLEQALMTHQDWDVQAAYNGLGSLAEIDAWAPSDTSSRALGAVAVRVQTLLLEGRRLNDWQLAWVLWSFNVNGTLRRRARPLLDSVMAAVGEAAAADNLAPNALTMMMRDAAAMRLHKSHPSVVAQLQRCTAKSAGQLGADRLAGALHCLGGQGCADASVLQPVADALMGRLGSEPVKEGYLQGAVAGLLKASEACAALDVQPLLGGLLEAATQRAAKLNSRRLGDLLWTFAQFRVLPDTPARGALAAAACKHVTSGRAEAGVAVRTLTVLPRLGHPVPPEVLSEAADRIAAGRSVRLEQCSGWLWMARKVSKYHPSIPKVAHTAERLLRGWVRHTDRVAAASAAATQDSRPVAAEDAITPAAATSPLEALRTETEAPSLSGPSSAGDGVGEQPPVTAANCQSWPKGFTQKSLRDLALAAADLDVPFGLVRAIAEFVHPRLATMDTQTQQALLATLAKCEVRDQALAAALADSLEAAVPAMNFEDLSRHLHSLSKLNLGPMQRQPVVDRLLVLLDTAQPSAGGSTPAAAAPAPSAPTATTPVAVGDGSTSGSTGPAPGTADSGLLAGAADAAGAMDPAAAAPSGAAALPAEGAPAAAEAVSEAAALSPAPAAHAALPSMQDISFVLQTLGHCTDLIPSQVVDAAIGAAGGRAAEADGNEVANVLWGLARLQMQQPQLQVRYSLIEEYVTRAAAIAHTVPHRHLSMVLWSLAALARGCPDNATLTILAEAFAKGIEQAPTQATANAVWALGKLRWHHGPLLAAAGRVAALRASEFGSRGWTGLLWGFHWLGADPGALADAILAEVTREKGLKPDVKLTAAGLWALAAAGQAGHPLTALLRGGLGTMAMPDAESLKIMGQAHALAVAEGVALWRDLPPRHRMAVQSAWHDRPGPPATDAARDAILEEIVAAALSAGLTNSGRKRPAQRHRVLGGALHVDVAVDTSAKVGLLLAGAEEVVRNTGRPVGRLAFRLKMLQLGGWRVGVVSTPEWQAWDVRLQALCLARVVEALSSTPPPEPGPGMAALEKGVSASFSAAANRAAAAVTGSITAGGGGSKAGPGTSPANREMSAQPQPAAAAAAAGPSAAVAIDEGAAASANALAAMTPSAADSDMPAASEAAASEGVATGNDGDSPRAVRQQSQAETAAEQQLHGSALAEALPSGPAPAATAATAGTGDAVAPEAFDLAAAAAAPPAGAANQQPRPPTANALPSTSGSGSGNGRSLSARPLGCSLALAATSLAGGSLHSGRRALVALASCVAARRSRRISAAAAASGDGAPGGSGDSKVVADDSKDGGHRSVRPPTQPEPAQPSDGQLDAAAGGDGDVAGAAQGSTDDSSSNNGNGDAFDEAEDSESGGYMDSTCDEEVCSLDFGDD